MKSEEQKKQRQFWLGMLVSAVCLAAIFLFVDPADVLAALRSARYEYLLLTSAGIVGFLVIRAFRWHFLLHRAAPWRTVFHIQNIGYLLTSLLPFRIGDVARAILLGGVPPLTVAQGISTTVVERVLDMLFIVIMLPFTLAQVERLPEWMRAGMQVTGILAAVAIFVMIAAANQRPLTLRLAYRLIFPLLRAVNWYVRRGQRLGRSGPLRRFLSRHDNLLDTQFWIDQIDRLLTGLDRFTSLRDTLVLIIFTILTWTPIVLAYQATMLAVNLEGGIASAGFVVGAAALSVAAPSSPGQVGVFHAGVFAALHGVLGQPEAASFNFALLYHALNIFWMVVLGVVGIQGTGSTFGKVVATARSFRGP